MSKLNELREVIAGVDNVETLEAGYNLFHELIEIERMKEKIANIEEGLTDGGKAMFYYFAMGLDPEELPFIAEKIKGRINRISANEDRSTSKAGSEGEG